MTKNVISPIRERVRKIYEIGKSVKLEDAEGEFELWLQKLNQAEEKEALTHSYKPRAAILALLKADDDDPGLLEFKDTMENWGLADRDTQINYLIMPDLEKSEKSAEARIAHEKEWSENDYLISLQEAWNDGVAEKFALDPEDAEGLRIYNELRRYTVAVEEAVEIERQELVEKWASKSDAYVEKQIVKMLIEHTASVAQLNEFHYWEIYFATRLPDDHSQRFFQSREEIETFADKFYSTLLEEYILMSLDSIEGKD